MFHRSLTVFVCCLWLLGCGANIQEPGDLAGETSALTRRPADPSVELLTPFIGLSPGAAAPMSTFGVSIGGFSPGEAVWIRFDGMLVTWLYCDAAGAATGSGWIPPRPRGTYSVEAKGALSGRSVSAPFTVMPGLLLAPNHGTPGTPIAASFSGFAAGEPVTIALDTLAFRMTAGSADSRGSGDASFALPFVSTGWHLLYAQGAWSGALASSYVYSEPPAAVCTNGPAGAPPEAVRSCSLCHVASYACYISGTWTCCDKRTCLEVYGGPGSGCDGR